MVESKHQWKAWLYLAPAIILLLVFTVWPIFNTVAMAFQNDYTASLAKNVSFAIGIKNFQNVIQGKDFLNSLLNTMILCVATVPISTGLALLIAVALNSIRPLQKVLQTIFFLPYVTNSIAIGMVFAAMFNVIGLTYVAPGTPDETIGILNKFLAIFGVEPIKWFTEFFKFLDWIDFLDWFDFTYAEIAGDSVGIVNNLLELVFGQSINWINQGSEKWANMAVLIIYIVWNALPFKILILLGGLQSINKQYYDAARVDGTPKARVLTRITVPLLSPMIAYVVITGFIGGFKEYSSIVGIFTDKMGPPSDPGVLNTMVGLVYDSLNSGAVGSQGKASAAALILFLIILVVTMINLRVSKKRVHY